MKVLAAFLSAVVLSVSVGDGASKKKTQTGPRLIETASPVEAPSALRALGDRTMAWDHNIIAAPPVASIAGSSFRTFGNRSLATGLAVESDTWTFDHGIGGPEGWSSQDRSANGFTAFRHITSAIWSGHGNGPAPPVITGAGSVWLGFFEDEADNACWKAGLGYGNNWRQRLKSPTLTNTSGLVTIAFDYFVDTESGFDFIYLVSQVGASRDTLWETSGSSGSPMSASSFSQSFSITGTFNLFLEFESDGSYSDEDSLFTTVVGAFGVDNFSVVGVDGPDPVYTFDAGLGGWVASAVPGAGTWAGYADISGYALVTSCPMTGNVMKFHTPPMLHAAGQHERNVSNVVDISGYGTAPLNVFAEYDVYADLTLLDNVFFTWGFEYFPYVCPVTGDSIWSTYSPSFVHYTGSAYCDRVRSFANDTTSAGGLASSDVIQVPAGTDSIRFFIEVVNFKTSASGNFSPLFDNIQVGVSDATTIIHVPSPAYPTIQAGIDAAGTGDTVLVRSGTYTGPGNRALDFSGKACVLLSEEGADSTIIDPEGVTRAFIFDSGETVATIVDGFTIRRGYAQIPGGTIRISPTMSSSPTLKNVKVVDSATNGANNGIIRVDGGSPLFLNCSMTQDTSTVSGGVLVVAGGSPAFVVCTFSNNVSLGEAISLLGGSPTLRGCLLSSNTATTGISIATAATIKTTTVQANSGEGMTFVGGVGASIVDTSYVLNNASYGIAMEDDNSSIFNYCVIQGNGGGMVIRNVTSLAASIMGSGVTASLGSSPGYTGCVFSGNFNTSAPGGGILFDCSNVPTTTFTPTYTDCIITGNSTAFDGGGIAVCGEALYADIQPLFQNCTIASNSANGDGGGIHSGVTVTGATSTVMLDQTILWGNCTTSGSGSQVFADSSNTVSFTCSNVDTNGLTGSGTIDMDADAAYGNPYFCVYAACDTSGTTEGDYSLAATTSNDPTNSPCGDLIGAYGIECAYPTSAGQMAPAAPDENALYPPVPNPFNPVTTIRFDLAEPGRVTLRIYDVAGRLVRTLFSGDLPADFHSRAWDGTDDRGIRVSSGVYFSRLETRRGAHTRKLVLIK